MLWNHISAADLTAEDTDTNQWCILRGTCWSTQQFTLITPHFHSKTFYILYITRCNVYFVSEGVLCLFTCLRHTQFPGNWRARWWEQQSIIQGWHSCSRNLTSLMKTGRETKRGEKRKQKPAMAVGQMNEERVEEQHSGSQMASKSPTNSSKTKAWPWYIW